MADVETVPVLVVSNDEAVIEDVRFGLPAHLDVTLASNATDASEIMADRDLHPAVVVVDQRTGNAGGFALARQMAAVRALKDVPILVLLEREQDAWLAKQAGAAMYRTKPMTAETLAAAVVSLLPN